MRTESLASLDCEDTDTVVAIGPRIVVLHSTIADPIAGREGEFLAPFYPAIAFLLEESRERFETQFASARIRSFQGVFVCHDGELVRLGDIVLGDYSDTVEPHLCRAKRQELRDLAYLGSEERVTLVYQSPEVTFATWVRFRTKDFSLPILRTTPAKRTSALS